MEMNGKFFIKDTALKNTDNDFFGHMDFAQNIINILNTQEPPFNVAVLGKWGLGKSSLINFVESNFNKRSNYEFITINAWKYEKEAFRKVFLKKTWERLGGTEKSWFYTLRDALNSVTVSETTSTEKRTMKSWFLPMLSFLTKAAIFFVVIAFLSIVWRFLGHGFTQGFSLPTFGSANGNPTVFSIYDATVKTFYSNALIAGALPVVLALVKEFLSSYDKKSMKNYNLISPAKTTDDYENLLLEQLNKPENSKKTIITVIDDLDRLAVEKIVDALDAIKSFADIPRCIFIVPFDESKIKEAIKIAQTQDCQTDCYAISELLMDKLFQFRVYLPGIVKRDFIPYAKDLCNSECPKLVALCDSIRENCFNEELLPVMIHYNVETPRQIKKIINVFANNILVVYQRQKNNKINFTMDAVLLNQVAKLSVLQADFSEFYNALYEHPSLLEDFPILSEQEEDFNKADVSRESKEVFKELTEAMPSFDFLLDFLNNHRHIKLSADEVRTLIYISDSKAAMRSGGKEQGLAHALSIGNGKMVKTALENFPDPCNYLISELLEGQLNRSTEKQYLVAIYQIYKDLDTIERGKLADVISRRTEIALSSYSFSERSSINIPDIMQVYLEASDKSGAEELIISKINEMVPDFKKPTDPFFINSVDVIFMQHKSLSPNIITAFKEQVIKKATDKDSGRLPLDIIEHTQITIDQELFELFINDSFVEVIASRISRNSITVGKAWESFLSLWDLYVSNFGADKMPDMAYPLLQKFEYLDLLFDRIVSIKDEIKDGMPLLIEAISQISINEDNSDRVIAILEVLDWQVYENISGDIDTCLHKLSELRYIDNLLKMLSVKDDFSLIKDTILSINTELLSGETPYIKIIAELAEQYEQDEKDDLLQKLTANLQPAVAIETVKNAAIVFKKLECLEDYADDLFDIKNSLVPLFNANYTRYPQWALEIVTVTGYKHNTDVQSFNAYLDLLNNLFQTNQELSLKGWRSISGTVTNVALDKMFDNVFSIDLEDSADQLADLCSLLKWWENALLKRPQRLPEYEKLLITCLKTNISVDSVIASLQKFKKINDISSLYGSTNTLDESHKGKVVKIIIEQIKGSDDPQQLLTELLSDSKIFEKGIYLDVVHGIYPSPEEGFFLTLLEGIDDNSSYPFMVNLFSVLSTSITRYKKGSILNLIKHIVRLNKKSADDIIPILRNMRGYFISNQNRYELKGYIETLQPTTTTTSEMIRSTIELLGLFDKKQRKKK